MAVSYSYLKNGTNKIALSIGFKDANTLHNSFKEWTNCQCSKIKPPNILQVFYPLSSMHNETYEIMWTPSTFMVLKFTNRVAHNDLSYSMGQRLVTIEDSRAGYFTEKSFVGQDEITYVRLQRAVQELVLIFSRRNQENAIKAGNFYFKVNESDL